MEIVYEDEEARLACSDNPDQVREFVLDYLGMARIVEVSSVEDGIKLVTTDGLMMIVTQDLSGIVLV